MKQIFTLMIIYFWYYFNDLYLKKTQIILNYISKKYPQDSNMFSKRDFKVVFILCYVNWI